MNKELYVWEGLVLCSVHFFGIPCGNLSQKTLIHKTTKNMTFLCKSCFKKWINNINISENNTYLIRKTKKCDFFLYSFFLSYNNEEERK